jgi:hypothetical protein
MIEEGREEVLHQRFVRKAPVTRADNHAGRKNSGHRSRKAGRGILPAFGNDCGQLMWRGFLVKNRFQGFAGIHIIGLDL